MTTKTTKVCMRCGYKGEDVEYGECQNFKRCVERMAKQIVEKNLEKRNDN